MESKNTFESKRVPLLSITFSLENETARVKETIEKLSWYRQHYGESNARLPEGVGDKTSMGDVAGIVSAEFNEDIYNDFAQHVQKEWANISNEIKRLSEMPDFHLLESYILRLTRYGSGGSYDSSRGIIIASIELRSKEKIGGTIIHEITHVGIEHLIKKYDLGHWQKEHLVDLIVDRYFPDLRKMQKIEEDVSGIDEAFQRHFPDIEAVVRAVGEGKQEKASQE